MNLPCLILSNVSPRNFIVSEPFTTSSPYTISSKSCLLRVDLVRNVMTSIFILFILRWFWSIQSLIFLIFSSSSPWIVWCIGLNAHMKEWSSAYPDKLMWFVKSSCRAHQKINLQFVPGIACLADMILTILVKFLKFQNICPGQLRVFYG